jgi:hypothetical protein
LTEFAAKLAEAQIEGIGGLTAAIFNFGLIIRAEEILLLPLVCLLADVEDLQSDDVPPFGPTTIKEIAVEEFCFRPQMVLSQRLGIGDE